MERGVGGGEIGYRTGVAAKSRIGEHPQPGGDQHLEFRRAPAGRRDVRPTLPAQPEPAHWYDLDCFENYYFVGRHADVIDGIDRYRAQALIPTSFLVYRAAARKWRPRRRSMARDLISNARYG